MTAPRSHELALRKQLLQRQSAVLRRGLALQSATALAPAFGVLDRVHQGGRWLVSHPALVAGITLWLFRRRPKGLWAWGSRAWWLWRIWRRLQPRLTGHAST